MFLMLMALRCIKSINLPGVATTICVSLFKRSICGFIGIPPQVDAIEIEELCDAYAVKLANICCPNSLVGANTNETGSLPR